MSETPDASAPAARRGVVHALFAAILLLALLLRGLDFFDPFYGKGFKSAFGAFIVGASARNFAEHGFLELSLMPTYARIELADGTIWSNWYTHHPALHGLLPGLSVELFGAHAWAMKLPALVFSLLSVWSVWRLARLAWGERAALLTALLLAVIPMSSWYGTLPYTDGAVVFFFGLIGRRYLLWLRHDRRADLVAVGAWSFVALLFDWPAFFLLPALTIHAAVVAMKRRGLRGLLPLAAWPAGVLAGIAVHKLHMYAVLPSDAQAEDTRVALERTMTLPVPLRDFVRLQLQYLFGYFTWPIVALCGAGILSCLADAVTARRSRAAWIALLLLPPGLLYVAVFPGRSGNHDFFLFESLAGIALLAAHGALRLDGIARRSAPRVRFLVPLALVATTVGCAWRHLEIWATRYSPRLERLEAEPWVQELVSDPDNVLLVSAGDAINLFLGSRAPIVHDLDDPRRIEDARRNVLGRLAPGRRVYFLFDLRLISDPGYAALHAWLLERADSHEAHVEHVTTLVDPIVLEVFELTSWSYAAGD